MRWVAAPLAFLAAYGILAVAYGELAPQRLNAWFRERSPLLGLLILILCTVAAVAVFLGLS